MPNPTLHAQVEQPRPYADKGFNGMAASSTTNPKVAYDLSVPREPGKLTAPLENAVDPSADTDKMPFPAGTYLQGD